ncbi:MAG: hypothetical protein K2K98_04695 [Muribaculaceae bacterium]|nr:hypothetical protein [Muribaculaceae bacterium]
MRNNRVKEFFTYETVGGEPEYGLAENVVRTAEAFANTTYQSVYIIDYFKRNIKITIL